MSGSLERMIPFDGPHVDILLLKQRGYCCSQIMVKLILRELGRDNADLVRSMAALCFGTGYSGGTCGVLTGGACALSLCLGGDSAEEQPDARLPGLLIELVEWFTARATASYGGTRCEDILAASPDKRACFDLLMAALEKIRELVETATNATAETLYSRRQEPHP